MKKLALLLPSLFVLTACGGNGGGVDVANSTKISCSEGYSVYEIDGTPMKICYSQAWGVPSQMEVVGASGKAYVVGFADAPNGPSVWYATKDYDDVSPEETRVCFDCFNLYGRQELVDESVVKALGLKAGEFQARKTDAGGRRGIRVDAGNTLTIYVPSAFDEYNMMIVGDSDVAEGVDEIAFDMKF